MKPIIIFGNKEVAESAWFYFEHDSERKVAAFTADRDYCDAPEFCGLPLLPFENLTQSHPPKEYDMFIALGYHEVNRLRKEKFLAARQKGYDFASYISSRATIWSKNLGKNCFILENNTIQPFTKIGDNVTLWSGNHIGHHSIIEDHCFITSHVVISGSTTVREECFIGVNATIRDGITIGQRCIIGAGVVISKHVADEEVFVAPRPVRYPYKIKKI